VADNARRIAHIACAQPLPSDMEPTIEAASSNSFEDLLILLLLVLRVLGSIPAD
jgi:hypothetical protein